MSELERAQALRNRLRLQQQAGPAQPQGSSANTLANRWRTLMGQGAQLGFGDELSGAIVATLGKLTGDERPWSDIYTDVRDREREELEAFREEAPVRAVAGEVLGGLAAGAAGGAKVAGTALARRFTAMPLRNRLLAASAGGAAGSAVGGAGAAPELADVPEYAARAAVPGLVLGPVAELGGTALGALWRARPRISPQAAAEQELARAIRRSDLTPQEAGARTVALGPGATLADVGQGTTAALERVAQQPGATTGRAMRQFARRSAQQVDELTEPFGPGRVNEMLRAAKADRQARAGPLYERAYAQGVENTPRLRNALERSPAVRTAWAQAKRDGRDWLVAEGLEEMDEIALGTAEPSLLGWRAINSKLNDKIGAAVRSGRDESARRLTGLRNLINEELDAQNPTYARARAIWSDSKSFEDTVAEGQKFLRQTSADVAEQFRNLDDAGRAAYKVGAAQAIQDRLFKLADTADASKVFRNRDVREKLRVMFDDPREFADAMNRIEAAAAKQRTMNQVIAGSPTGRRIAQQAEESMVGQLAGATADVATGVPAAGVASQWLRGLARRVPTSRETTRDLLGEMLLETEPERINRLLQATGARALPYRRPPSAVATAPVLGAVTGAALPEPPE